jgi:multicomponent Na+:H+ antiporter subunit D
MNPLIVLPLILPFATATLALALNKNLERQYKASLLGGTLHCAACLLLLANVYRDGMTVIQVGKWPSPFGITLAADHLSAILVAITGILGLAVIVYSRVEIKPFLRRGGYDPLLHILLGGVCGAFLTGDLFNLYVWFEVMLMASFGLIVLGREKIQFDGGVKYVMINLFSTLLFIMGIGLLYGMTGTLNLAALHGAVQSVPNPSVLMAVAGIFITAFGIKAGIFPLFFWLPVSYHTPPAAVSGILAGLLTKVGVYALIRLFTLVFITDMAWTHDILLVLSIATMITGVLGAAAFQEVRRILSFHIISQVGYMVMGLALFTPLALTGTVFYLMHHMIVKANLFLISGAIRRAGGSFDLEKLGGLYKNKGQLAVLFFIPAFSLAGFPPLSGFWAKMILIRAALENAAYGTAAAAVGGGLLTVYSMTKIWGEAFWKPAPGSGRNKSPDHPLDPWMMAPIAVLAGMSLIIGLAPGLFISLSERAAFELTHPEIYICAVLGALP